MTVFGKKSSQAQKNGENSGFCTSSYVNPLCRTLILQFTKSISCSGGQHVVVGPRIAIFGKRMDGMKERGRSMEFLAKTR